MNVPALKAEIARNELTYAQVANRIGMSETTFWRRLKTGDFGIDEANKLISVLNITRPELIFFDQN